MRNVAIIIGLTGTLGGCGIGAKIEARNNYAASRAAYKECLNDHAPNQCESKRLAMEADQHAYDDLSAGIQKGGNQTLTINSQSQ